MWFDRQMFRYLLRSNARKAVCSMPNDHFAYLEMHQAHRVMLCLCKDIQ